MNLPKEIKAHYHPRQTDKWEAQEAPTKNMIILMSESVVAPDATAVSALVGKAKPETVKSRDVWIKTGGVWHLTKPLK